MKEQTKKYLQLISRVAAIDINAALYLLCDAPDTDGFNEGDSLMSIFSWKDTPQGANYWVEINRQLRR